MLSRDVFFEKFYFPYKSSTTPSSTANTFYDTNDHISLDFFQLPSTLATCHQPSTFLSQFCTRLGPLHFLGPVRCPSYRAHTPLIHAAHIGSVQPSISSNTSNFFPTFFFFRAPLLISSSGPPLGPTRSQPFILPLFSLNQPRVELQKVGEGLPISSPSTISSVQNLSSPNTGYSTDTIWRSTRIRGPLFEAQGFCL